MNFILAVILCFLLPTISAYYRTCYPKNFKLCAYNVGQSCKTSSIYEHHPASPYNENTPACFHVLGRYTTFCDPKCLPVRNGAAIMNRNIWQMFPYCEFDNFNVSTFKGYLKSNFRGKNAAHFGKVLLTLDKVDSTQDLLAGFADAMPTIVVIADEQTKGRARNGQNWTSPMGDVYMSVDVNLTDHNLSPLLQSIAAISIIDAIHEKRSGYQNIDLSFTWPNSVSWRNHKIAGVLVESGHYTDPFSGARGRRRFGVGIGVRLNSTSDRPTLNSIIVEHNQKHGTVLEPLKREELIARILNNFETLIDIMGNDSDLVRKILSMKLAKQSVQFTNCSTYNLKGNLTEINVNNELIIKHSHGFRVLIDPDLYIISTNNTILSSPVSYQLTNSSSTNEIQ